MQDPAQSQAVISPVLIIYVLYFPETSYLEYFDREWWKAATYRNRNFIDRYRVKPETNLKDAKGYRGGRLYHCHICYWSSIISKYLINENGLPSSENL